MSHYVLYMHSPAPAFGWPASSSPRWTSTTRKMCVFNLRRCAATCLLLIRMLRLHGWVVIVRGVDVGVLVDVGVGVRRKGACSACNRSLCRTH